MNGANGKLRLHMVVFSAAVLGGDGIATKQWLLEHEGIDYRS